MFKEYVHHNYTPSPLSEQTGLYPCWTGRLRADINYQCNSRTLDDYFMIFVNRGSGSLTSGRDRFRLRTKDYYFLFPGVIHSYCTSRKHLMELYWVGFNGFLANRLITELNIHPANPILRFTEADDETVSILEKIISMPESSEPLGLSASLLSLFSRLISASGAAEIPKKALAGSQKQHSNPVLKALAYLDQNYTSDISISELAEYTNLSRSAFSRLFKNETGRSPKQYLTDIRMQQAEYLLSSGMSVRSAAHSIGIEDEYYFSRCFKKIHNIPPNAYKKEKTEQKKEKSAALTDKAWL